MWFRLLLASLVICLFKLCVIFCLLQRLWLMIYASITRICIKFISNKSIFQIILTLDYCHIFLILVSCALKLTCLGLPWVGGDQHNCKRQQSSIKTRAVKYFLWGPMRTKGINSIGDHVPMMKTQQFAWYCRQWRLKIYFQWMLDLNVKIECRKAAI